MTGADKFNKYYLVTAAEYEKRQLKPPPFTHKGIQNARIARAYEGVQDAQNNVTGKTIYQAMTELDREVDQLATRQPQYQDRNMRRSPDRRQEREPRDRNMSMDKHAHTHTPAPRKALGCSLTKGGLTAGHLSTRHGTLIKPRWSKNSTLGFCQGYWGQRKLTLLNFSSRPHCS